MPFSPQMDRFATAVRCRRLKHAISQTELARRVGISVKTMNNFERAVCWPSIPVYFAICRELQTRKPPFA
jgi:DNA-binding XRE family transcriptional regulator